MFTAWVILTTGKRPRRVHRMRIEGITKCGIRTRYRIRFISRFEMRYGPRPPFCHECFQYKYRFWSKGREVT